MPGGQVIQIYMYPSFCNLVSIHLACVYCSVDDVLYFSFPSGLFTFPQQRRHQPLLYSQCLLTLPMY